MLQPLAAGVTDAGALADLALGRLRSKLDQLQKALDGRLQPTQCVLIRRLLEDYRAVDRKMEQLDREIERYIQGSELRSTVERWTEIPGIQHLIARVAVAELGTNMQERNHQGKDNLLLFPVAAGAATARGADPLSGAARRLTQILQPRRMSIFTIPIEELHTYVERNQALIPNYGERYRHGERIASGFVESAVNQVVSKRMVKQQQMQCKQGGAHLLLQIRTRVLNEEWEDTFRRSYRRFRPQTQEKPVKKAA
jgi:hypothetical protein